MLWTLIFLQNRESYYIKDLFFKGKNIICIHTNTKQVSLIIDYKYFFFFLILYKKSYDDYKLKENMYLCNYFEYTYMHYYRNNIFMNENV